MDVYHIEIQQFHFLDNILGHVINFLVYKEIVKSKFGVIFHRAQRIYLIYHLLISMIIQIYAISFAYKYNSDVN